MAWNVQNSSSIAWTKNGGLTEARAIFGTEAGTVAEGSALATRPEHIEGTATQVDGYGNPTPDPNVHDPAAFPIGTLLRATNLGSTAMGYMLFQRQDDGVAYWAWIDGHFHISNANGIAHRWVDGRQMCHTGPIFIDLDAYSYSEMSGTWTYPLAFSSAERGEAEPAIRWHNGTTAYTDHVYSAGVRYENVTGFPLILGTTTFEIYATGAGFDAGMTRQKVSAKVEGRWD